MKEDLKRVREKLNLLKEGKEEPEVFLEEALRFLRKFLAEKHGVKCTSPPIVYKTLYYAGYLGREELEKLLSDPHKNFEVFESLFERVESSL